MRTVFIIGCGYIGERVAKLEATEGARVLGLARSDQSANNLEKIGIEPIRGDLDEPDSLKELPAKETVLYYFAPPPSQGLNDPRMTGLTAALTSPNLPKRVVLISTTGVYGDCQGRWITEEEPPKPESDRAHRRLAAETALRKWAKAENVPTVTLRVPGIYGPGRLPQERLRKGEPVLREQEAPFSNRIHAHDLARACVAASRRGRPGAVYNISDGRPTTMTDYFFRVADLLGMPRPRSITMEEARQKLSAGMLSYLVESKRIDNLRMREELGVDPVYPDLAAGLQSCLDPDSEEHH